MSVGAIVLLLLLITLLLVVTVTWSSFPNAKYIKIARNDSDSNYVAIGDIEAYDNKGNKVNFINTDGSGYEQYGLPAGNTTGVTADNVPIPASTVGAVPFISNGVVTKNYMKTGLAAAAATGSVIGPCMGGINGPAAASPGNYILYVMSCPAKISKINITAIENTQAKRYLQNCKVVLLDADRNTVKGSEKIIPYTNEPRSVHHFTYG